MSYRAFIDESSATRGEAEQEYLICAAIVRDDECGAAREALRPLLLPGQIKVHWTDESSSRHRKIVTQIVELGPMTVIVAHLDAKIKKVERYRRKCLETLYHELIAMGIFEAVLESRSSKQDKADLAHIVALRRQGLNSALRVNHKRGGDEPLLWIPDAVLGAINAAHLGKTAHYDNLRSTLVLEKRTPESRYP